MSVYTDLLNSSDSLYTPIVWSTTTNAIPSVAGTLTVTATIVDSNTKKPIEKVNVYVNDKAVTQTNASGKFTLYNLKPDDFIRTSHLSYGEYFSLASDISNTIQLGSQSNILPELTLFNKHKETNWLLPLGIVAIGFLAYRKYGKKATVKAKI